MEVPHWRNSKRRFDIFEMQKGGHTCSIHNTFRRIITANKKPVKWKACHDHSKGNEWAYWICGDWSDNQVNWGQQHANGYEYKYLREKTEIIEVVLPKSKTFKDCCVFFVHTSQKPDWVLSSPPLKWKKKKKQKEKNRTKNNTTSAEEWKR